MSIESASKCWERCKQDENLRNSLRGLGPEQVEDKVKSLGYDFTLDEMMIVMGGPQLTR